MRDGFRKSDEQDAVWTIKSRFWRIAPATNRKPHSIPAFLRRLDHVRPGCGCQMPICQGAIPWPGDDMRVSPQIDLRRLATPSNVGNTHAC